MRNRLKHWRYRCEMEQKEFADFLGINQSQVSRYERQEHQPSVESLFYIWQKLKERFPEIHIEDLIEGEKTL